MTPNGCARCWNASLRPARRSPPRSLRPSRGWSRQDRDRRAQPWYHGYSYAYGYSYEHTDPDRWFVRLDVEPPFWRRSREQVVAMLEEEIKLIMTGAA